MKNNNKLFSAIVLAMASHQTLADMAGDYDTKNWVHQVYQHRAETTLRQMVIPGTHDSGTYNISASSDVAPDGNAIFNIAKEAAAEWGKTQSYNMQTMLEKGIRHFDLRIKKHKGEFVIVHGLVGMKVRDVLQQVQSFADSHPKEPIILEVAKTPDAADMPALLDMFDQYVGQRKPDNSIKPAYMTLNQIWANDNQDGKNNNVLVIWASSSSEGKLRGYYGAEELEGTWADTEDSGPLYDRLLNGWNRKGRQYKGLKNAPQDKLFYSAFTFTPQESTVIKDALNPFGDISLLSWTQDWMRSYLGEWVPGWVKSGYRPNIMTADFFEYTAMIPQAIQLNTQAPVAPSQPLEVFRTSQVSLVWNDDDSGADKDAAIWTPTAKAGYKPLAHIPTGSWSFDYNVSLYLVKENQPDVAKPLGYNWVWNDRESGAKTDVSIWRPIAPAGFVCLGDVATTNHGLAPSTDMILCVHQSYVTQAPSMYRKWTDKGSGAKYDVSLWDSANHNGSTLNIGAMRAVRNYNQPATELFQLIRKDKIQEMN